MKKNTNNYAPLEGFRKRASSEGGDKRTPREIVKKKASSDSKKRVFSKDDRSIGASSEEKPKRYTRNTDDRRTSDRRTSDRRTSDRRTSDRRTDDRRTDDRRTSDRRTSDRRTDDRRISSRGSEEKRSPYKKDGNNRNDFTSKDRGEKRSTFRGKSTFNPKKISINSKSKTPKIPKDDDSIRLNKFISNSGICSRREADDYIVAGLVSVNGTVVTELGVKVKRSDDIRFNSERLKGEEKVYILMNKPKDFVTTTSDPHAEKSVMDLVAGKCPQRVYPVGRLDKQTTGVLLLTNDGELADKLTHPSNEKKKIYHVFLDKNLKSTDFAAIINGVKLEDGEIKADELSYIEGEKSQVGIEIHSGRNRIVRRIFESLGYRVKKLDRVYFAGLTKKNLRRGQWRFLSNEEVNFLKLGGN